MIPNSSMTESSPRVTHFELAMAFNYIALASFGGGLSAWSREMLVVRKRWMDDDEFLSAMTMCRILPGANQVNMAVFAGTKMRGGSGALAAMTFDNDLTINPLPVENATWSRIKSLARN